MEFIEQIKSAIPDHAKDIRLNLDAVLQRSSLEPTEAIASALAAAYASKSAIIVRALEASGIEPRTGVAFAAESRGTIG